jgi:hypothetical protein
MTLSVQSRIGKGKRGERGVVSIFQATMAAIEQHMQVPTPLRHSRKVARNLMQARDGGRDIVGIPGLCIEVKNQAKPNVPAAMQQAKAAAEEGELPIVIYNKDGKWFVRCEVFSLNPAVIGGQVDVNLIAFMQWWQGEYRKFLANALLTARKARPMVDPPGSQTGVLGEQHAE